MKPTLRKLVEEAAAPYRAVGRFAWNFARGKLRGDPVFAALLARGLIADDARVLDIGCGQGLLAAWLLAARTRYDQGDWPPQWPAPARPRSVHGIELMPRDVERAKQALGSAASFTCGDMRTTEFGAAEVAVILDVLHYVSIAEQDAVLQRVRRALSPHGTLLLRVGDAAAGLRFHISVWVDRIVTFVRGHRGGRLYCRPLSAWHSALTALGFEVTALPMYQGTPFANVLLVAKLGQNSALPVSTLATR